MYKKILVLLALCLIVPSCGASDGSSSGGIGSPTGGSSVTANGYDYNNQLKVIVKISPYSNGFKATFTPQTSSGVFICSVSNSVSQSGSQFTFTITDTKSNYEQLAEYYDGYVESGAFDSCATYTVETVWVVFASDTGFSASSSYTVILDSVTTDGFTAQQISVVP